MIQSDDFPRLKKDNHRITSPVDLEYNCVAWAVSDAKNWWQPGIYWPVEMANDDFGVGALEQAFLALGYRECADGRLEPGIAKVALYGSSFLYTHAARQLPTGKWTSKLGKAEDIEHDTPDDVAGPLYGEVVQFMARPAKIDG